MSWLKGTTPPYATAEGITELRKVRIGGVDQWILIRGSKRSNPVLLFVHGGPGQSNMYLSHLLDGELEKHYTVVNWDQRGAGKSYVSGKRNPSGMNLEQLVQDAGEVISYIKDKLGAEKLFVMGHSFGTILGMLIAHRYPAHVRAYIGICQAVGLLDSLTASYDWLLEQAEKQGDVKSARELKAVGPPPFRHFAKGLWKYSVILQKYGGKVYSKKGWDLFKAIWSAPEYTLPDKLRYVRGVTFSVKHLHRELLNHSLLQAVTKVEVPVVFMLGAHDQATPSELAVRYLERLQAPSKETVWFRQSAHVPHYEEPDKFLQEMIRLRDRSERR
ncbi:alpha/beta fold hydrolase [Paenibacillus thailandensis]|uniref:Alpha/beta fold hydrolase n=1 Tax=Paenibacillus thailandensis TaxID=393250 RepID=A0ABW5R416_9BACL